MEDEPEKLRKIQGSKTTISSLHHHYDVSMTSSLFFGNVGVENETSPILPKFDRGKIERLITLKISLD